MVAIDGGEVPVEGVVGKRYGRLGWFGRVGSGVLVGVGKLEVGVMVVVVVVGVLKVVQAARPGASANRARNRRRFMISA